MPVSPSSVWGFHIALLGHFFLVSLNLSQTLKSSLCLLWPLHFWRELIDHFVECSLIWFVECSLLIGIGDAFWEIMLWPWCILPRGSWCWCDLLLMMFTLIVWRRWWVSSLRLIFLSSIYIWGCVNPLTPQTCIFLYPSLLSLYPYWQLLLKLLWFFLFSL